MSKTEAIADMVVLLIFGNHVDFDSEVVAGGARMRGYRDGAIRSIDRIVLCCQPKIVEDLSHCPFGSKVFAGARADLLYVLPAELIGVVHLVVSRGVNLVVRPPG